MTNKVWLVAVMASLLTGCAARTARTSAQPAALPPPPDLVPASAVIPDSPPLPTGGRDADYVDLRAAWRLRVTTPLVRSGGYEVKSAAEEVNGNTVTLSAGADLEGYESAFYSVRPRTGGGVRIAFSSAEVTKGGETVPQPRPSAYVFQVAPEARFVRLLYLLRLGVNRADHDMAVIAAEDLPALDALTGEVRLRPGACRSDAHTFCFWIPRGIAVQPEEPAGAELWAPVR